MRGRLSRVPLLGALAMILCAGVMTANAAPRMLKIWGSPTTVVLADHWYDFKPSFAGAMPGPIWFTISNKPAWAFFDAKTGRIGGVPRAGVYSNIIISVNDAREGSSLNPFSIVVRKNTAPLITGSPRASVSTGSYYYFRPSFLSTDSEVIWFTIENKPAWAWFNALTGELGGIPRDPDTHSNIKVSVTDGVRSTSLAPFSIVVSRVSASEPPRAMHPPSTSAVTLTWLPPTERTDESILTNLAGYKVHYGVARDELTQLINIPNAGISSFVVENLASTTYYFAVSAYTVSGEESDLSNIIVKNLQ